MIKPHTIYHIEKPSSYAFDDLTRLWEESVRATHHFLSEDDIVFMRPKMRSEWLPHVALQVARNDEGALLGFIGVAERKIEMLFIAPEHRGQGVGSTLLNHAVQKMGADNLDVNEQNPDAINFYKHLGFEVVGRSALDSMGNPFPLLHMRLAPRNTP